jgi:hypothetical protein
LEHLSASDSREVANVAENGKDFLNRRSAGDFVLQFVFPPFRRQVVEEKRHAVLTNDDSNVEQGAEGGVESRWADDAGDGGGEGRSWVVRYTRRIS